MQPGHSRPAHDEQTAKDHEHDEGEMDDNRGVCEHAEGHDSDQVRRAGCSGWLSGCHGPRYDGDPPHTRVIALQ